MFHDFCGWLALSELMDDRRPRGRSGCGCLIVLILLALLLIYLAP